ncbi:MAG TPA: prephenate dehydrogenase [Candidatus Acidoferrales bacterium]|nr:prephenate dehydrogenase [Candidatus Acidoferrales bacterium]
MTMFRRAAILGTGLMGGSFALALRKHFPETQLIGWDRADVLDRAAAREVIDEGFSGLADAVRGADLIYIALPIGAALEHLPEIAQHADAAALVTDACSTKNVICRAAEKFFHGGAMFLGGHPMSGKAVKGVENADAEIFVGAKYVLIGDEHHGDARAKEFAALISALGAQPVWMDAETHDWAVGIVSHLPQLVSVALAQVIRDETDETGLPLSVAGPGLRDTVRLASSPYAIWRDICLTNPENLSRALDRVAQAIDHIRTRLQSNDLRESFEAANELYRTLQELK